jgi:hypothetical protein
VLMLCRVVLAISCALEPQANTGGCVMYSQSGREDRPHNTTATTDSTLCQTRSTLLGHGDLHINARLDVDGRDLGSVAE